MISDERKARIHERTMEDPIWRDGTEDDFFEEDEPLEDVVTAFEQGENVPRRVTFIGQPGAGKSTLAGNVGERCDGTEPPFEGEIPATARCCGTNICGTGIVGMFALGGDLSRRAKDIVRGNDGICKCPAEACVCRERPVDGSP